ncbi:biotin/lipoyl-containing protein [Amycolatopsis benzoatilytica]|uniref:biotin/lipoyl-containing protein n=1 Tax=Amycolatopsis benzoatilytica TaxID=346045 RepID=UPI0003772968|nr:biotin/lipoyl-containing protein [Amycolatopsis benzoatilytica]
MAYELTMPNLGDTVEEAEVTQWFKEEGDEVDMDEILLEIATDKIENEIPAPVSGVIAKIHVPVQTTVPVGTLLAEIEQR